MKIILKNIRLRYFLCGFAVRDNSFGLKFIFGKYQPWKHLGRVLVIKLSGVF